MSIGIITFIVIYCLLVCAYLYTAPSGNMKLRAPNKCLLALMFFIFGVVMFTTRPGFSLQSYNVMIVVSLFMLMLGDIFLLFDFGRGGDFFLAGNVILFTYELATLEHNNIHINQYWWIFLAVPLMVGFIIFITSKFKKKFHFGKFYWPMMFYLITVSLHGFTGIALMSYANTTSCLLLGCGTFLFMLSDYDITFDRFYFDHNPWTLRLNAITYFIGLLLIALSLAF